MLKKLIALLVFLVPCFTAHGSYAQTTFCTQDVEKVEKLLGDHAKNVLMSSTKSATGHLLGAAGAVEAIFSILAMRDGMAPPTLNLDNPSVDTPLDLVPHTAKPFDAKAVMSNSFGFGGTNAAVIFAKVD